MITRHSWRKRLAASLMTNREPRASARHRPDIPGNAEIRRSTSHNGPLLLPSTGRRFAPCFLSARSIPPTRPGVSACADSGAPSSQKPIDPRTLYECPHGNALGTSSPNRGYPSPGCAECDNSHSPGPSGSAPRRSGRAGPGPLALPARRCCPWCRAGRSSPGRRVASGVPALPRGG
jgi:hypothetical protein